MSTLTEKKARNLAFSYKKFHPMPLPSRKDKAECKAVEHKQNTEEIMKHFIPEYL